MLDILEGKRPEITKDTPEFYADLMKKCWEREPENRPSAIKISEILKEWQSDENILLELTKSDEILQNIKNLYHRLTCDRDRFFFLIRERKKGSIHN